MKEGKVSVNFKRLYGYCLLEDGTPSVDAEKGPVVRQMYERYLYGDSLRMLKDGLEKAGIPNPKGESDWKISTIKGILTNEKYCGDVLGQKTFKENVIGGKSRRITASFHRC